MYQPLRNVSHAFLVRARFLLRCLSELPAVHVSSIFGRTFVASLLRSPWYSYCSELRRGLYAVDIVHFREGMLLRPWSYRRFCVRSHMTANGYVPYARIPSRIVYHLI